MARVTKQTPTPVATDPLTHFDLAFVIDTTGSMGPFIQAAREHMVGLLKRLTGDAASPVDLHVGIVEYRDHPPQDTSFVTREYGFTGELAAVQKAIAKLSPAGGGDAPEAALDGLRSCALKLKWRPHSRRVAVLIGDAPPHGWRGQAPHGTCACGAQPGGVERGLPGVRDRDDEPAARVAGRSQVQPLRVDGG